MTQSIEDAAKPSELPERIEKSIPTTDSPLVEILNFMRSSDQYQKSHIEINPNVKHQFHKRYHAKPHIYNSFLDRLHLCGFKVGGRLLEYLEFQTTTGLTDKVIVIDGMQQFQFKSVLEAETYIADQLAT